jgi:hypothetical protein
MNKQSSFTKVAEQVVNFNNTTIESLKEIEKISLVF